MKIMPLRWQGAPIELTTKVSEKETILRRRRIAPKKDADVADRE